MLDLFRSAALWHNSPQNTLTCKWVASEAVATGRATADKPSVPGTGTGMDMPRGAERFVKMGDRRDTSLKRRNVCHYAIWWSLLGGVWRSGKDSKFVKRELGWLVVVISLDVVVFWRKEETMVNEWQVRNQKIGRSCSTCSLCMQYNITLWFWGAQLKRFVFMNMFHFLCSQ